MCVCIGAEGACPGAHLANNLVVGLLFFYLCLLGINLSHLVDPLFLRHTLMYPRLVFSFLAITQDDL